MMQYLSAGDYAEAILEAEIEKLKAENEKLKADNIKLKILADNALVLAQQEAAKVKNHA